MKVNELLEATMQNVDSSNIASIGWKDGNLEVEFLNGSLYMYLDVPESVFEEFIESYSKGQFLARNIKGQYEYRKIS